MNDQNLPPAGTLAIVQTAAFRCLAVMGECGNWLAAYHQPPKIVEEVNSYRVCGEWEFQHISANASEVGQIAVRQS